MCSKWFHVSGGAARQPERMHGTQLGLYIV